MDTHHKEVISRLRELASVSPASIVLAKGICYNLRSQGLPCESVSRYASDWRSYSGSTFFPIPCPEHDKIGKTWKGKWMKFWYGIDVDSPSAVQFRTMNLWAGEQGELRRSLCIHVAEALERQMLL